MNTVQYITLTILLPRVLDPSFIVQISSDALYFQEGTVYLKTSTVNSNTLVYSHPDNQKIKVSGFSGTIPTGSLITVTFSAWIGASPIFNVLLRGGAAFSDISAIQFIKDLITEFPGYIQIRTISMKKNNDL